jgi:radical SAM enzyme (TIGR01210 family)
MDKETVTRQILRASSRASKSYTFDDEHDASVPVETWFQQSQEGEILFVVFYSQACRWSRCLSCNLPSKVSSKHVAYRSLVAQVDHLFKDARVKERRQSIRKVIVSNNGSILDEATFSSTALMYLLVQLNLHFPNLSVLSIETRPEYVDLAELEFMSRALEEGDTPTQLEIAIGFEAFDDHIRNGIFDKGLRLDAFERFVREVAPYKYRLKCYFMQKPVPNMTDSEAVADIRNAIDYLDQIASRYGIDINMHLNPTYVATGTILEDVFRKRDYDPPRLYDVARAVRHANGKGLSVFVGLSDEGLAVEGGSFIRPGDEPVVKALEEFNRSQDYAILDNILCPRG